MLRRAFTLIELLIVTAMVAGGIVFVLYADFFSIRMVNDTYLRLFITKNVLEYELEYLEGQPFDSLIISGPTAFTQPFVLTPTPPQSFAELGAMTANTYTIASVDINLKRVTVTVTWKDEFGRSRTQSLSTVISLPL